MQETLHEMDSKPALSVIKVQFEVSLTGFCRFNSTVHKDQEVQSSVTSLGDETSSGIVSDEEIEKKELEAHYGFMAKIQEVLPAESKCIDERAALANLIANLTLDTEENKIILKQLKKANASLTQELKECKQHLE
ncbi:hypothetical protein Tco_0976992 [Tanacetum coccineum]|uniref:Uncharacterized protein n=1 Tax=Tanacetum coccineum TaxID=301880 RepID=A0ABQ5EIV0_9ASTR